MSRNKRASDEARKIRRREAKQNSLTKIILIVCAVMIIFCVYRYFSSGDTTAQRTLFLLAGTALYLCSFSSLASGSWTIGMFPPAVAGTFVVSMAALYDVVFPVGKSTLSCALIVPIAAAAVFIAMFLVIFIFMFAGSLCEVKKGEDITVVVLGCRLKGLKPGRMLRRRLNAAVRCLERFPLAYCIVSGGRGSDEEATEAEVMAQYLIENGIAPERIFSEDRSATTYENIRFGKALAEKEDLPLCFAIASDRFHQLRARLICNDNGIPSRCVNAETAPYLALQYWSREAMCIVEKLIKRL